MAPSSRLYWMGLFFCSSAHPTYLPKTLGHTIVKTFSAVLITPSIDTLGDAVPVLHGTIGRFHVVSGDVIGNGVSVCLPAI